MSEESEHLSGGEAERQPQGVKPLLESSGHIRGSNESSTASPPAHLLLAKFLEVEPQLYEQILDSNAAYYFNELCKLALSSGESGKDKPEPSGSPSRDLADVSPPAHPLDEIVERANFATIVCNYFGTAFLPKALCVQLEDATRRACEAAMKLEHDWWLSLPGIEEFIKEKAKLNDQLAPEN